LFRFTRSGFTQTNESDPLSVVRSFSKDEIGKNESIYIVWDEALQESLGTLFTVSGISFQYDAEKTKLENK